MCAQRNIRKLLNVGGQSKGIPIPEHYKGWEHHLLDVDPRGNPDILCDARHLSSRAAGVYDAIYCSHNLEHYYPHEVPNVLRGFHHVLRPDGFAEIRVPDLGELMRIVVQRQLDLDDFLYQSPAGPITVRDVVYGYGAQIETSGNDFFAHKTGFTQNSLRKSLSLSGFVRVFCGSGNLEIRALAFKATPTDYYRRLLGIH